MYVDSLGKQILEENVFFQTFAETSESTELVNLLENVLHIDHLLFQYGQSFLKQFLCSYLWN